MIDRKDRFESSPSIRIFQTFDFFSIFNNITDESFEDRLKLFRRFDRFTSQCFIEIIDLFLTKQRASICFEPVKRSGAERLKLVFLNAEALHHYTSNVSQSINRSHLLQCFSIYLTWIIIRIKNQIDKRTDLLRKDIFWQYLSIVSWIHEKSCQNDSRLSDYQSIHWLMGTKQERLVC